MSEYPESKQHVVCVYPPDHQPAYVAGSFDTGALANQFIGKQGLDGLRVQVYNKKDYPGNSNKDKKEIG